MVYGRRRLRTPVFLKQSRIDGVDVNHSRRNACQRTACAVYLSQKKKGKRDTLRTENIDANQLKKKCYYRRGLGGGGVMRVRLQRERTWHRLNDFSLLFLFFVPEETYQRRCY